MGAPILSEDAIQDAFRKYCEGIMLKDLADQYGVNPKSLGSIFARRGLKRGEYHKSREKNTCADCPKDCRFSMSLHGKNGEKRSVHCGYILFPGNGSRGCDPGMSCTRYEPEKKKEPVSITVKKPRPPWDKEKARQMWKDGKSICEIAEAVGVHPETIRKIRRRKWMNEEVERNADD